MNSMTGFGRSAVSAGEATGAVEIRSVNNRFLKIKVVLPSVLQSFEKEAEDLVRGAAARGTLQLSVALDESSAAPLPVLDHRRLAACRDQIESARKSLRLKGEADLGLLLNLPFVWRSAPDGRDRVRTLWPAVKKGIRAALREFARMRAREGASLRKACVERLDRLDAVTARTEKRMPEVVQAYHAKLRERVAVLVGPSGAAAPADLARELAVFADKCDVTEELHRLKAHLAVFRQTIAAGGEMGRRLDFLTQELLREANTLGSKASDAAVAADVVDMKAEIEKLKELIENVE